MAVAHLSDSKPPKDESLRLLRAEMQRCLGSLKGKRQKISQLQEELRLCQSQVQELQTQVEEAKLSAMLLEKNNKDLKQSEEKLKSTNLELCTKMREMIQELTKRSRRRLSAERINQQHRDDVVNRVRTELMHEHDVQVEQLTAEHQQQVHRLQTELTEANDKLLAVQECYISVCREKDELEERGRNRAEEENLIQEKEQNIREEGVKAMEKLRAELEAQHQASVNQMKSLWCKEKETEIQLQVKAQVALAKAAWKEEHLKMEKTWDQRLEEARRENHRETAEATCQAAAPEASRGTVTVEELDSRLRAQEEQLHLEADKVKHKAVEEVRKQTQRQLHKKHLEDMAKQVEGAVTRAYNRWIEDLTSLPEYQASLQREKEKWEELHRKLTEQRVGFISVREAEEQWHRKQKNQLEEQSPGTRTMEQLQEEVADLQTQLEQARQAQAALMKAELAGARATWNRDKQQELSAIQDRMEQAYQSKLLEQRRKLEQTLQQAREEAASQKEELLLQTEARLQQIVETREEERKRQSSAKEEAQRQQTRGEMLRELQAALADVQAQFQADPRTGQQDSEDMGTNSGATSEHTLTRTIKTSCRDIVNAAVSRAKEGWKRVSLWWTRSGLRKEGNYFRQVLNTLGPKQLLGLNPEKSLYKQSKYALSQRKESPRCSKECPEIVGKLQRKNQELQRHLEKACRQLQRSGEGAQKRRAETEGSCDYQQRLQRGLEELKQQYLTTVEKIRGRLVRLALFKVKWCFWCRGLSSARLRTAGDVMLYLQESRERAAEMIRLEVQRERRDTARKMRYYYLSCLQELLQDGGQTTGAESKIMSTASKLAAMAKVLETPVKGKP
ncbi:unnamed protein product, partial [Tetraodon nigroviridis]